MIAPFYNIKLKLTIGDLRVFGFGVIFIIP
jgi:hypothetical protein